MARKLKFRLYYGNKGFILTLDMVLAMIIVFIFIAVSSFYITTSINVPSSDLVMLRTASDIVATLDYTDSFDSLDTNSIKTDMLELLPLSYNLEITLEGNFPDGKMTIESESERPESGFISAGRRLIIINNGGSRYYAIAKYRIWTK